jgi:hypothetical protein
MPEDGSLRNTDGLFEIEALGEDGASKFLQMGKTFQGGNWNHLQAMLDIEAGEEILYVGDHLYADVLRSKRALGWRSCFIMPELPEEMRIFHNQLGLWNSIMELRKLRDELTYYADGLRKEQQLAGSSKSSYIETRLELLEEDEGKLKNKLAEAHKEYHSAFHSRWGQMVSKAHPPMQKLAIAVNSHLFHSLWQATKILGSATLSKIMLACTQVRRQIWDWPRHPVHSGPAENCYPTTIC